MATFVAITVFVLTQAISLWRRGSQSRNDTVRDVRDNARTGIDTLQVNVYTCINIEAERSF